jgi:tetratricopeptide (TPR) repeat protein
MKSLLLLLTLSLTISPAFSQSAAEWKKSGIALEAKGQTQQALDAFLKAETLSPKDPEILVKIAKQYGDLIPSLKGKARKTSADKALEYARKAVAIAPKTADPHLALALSLGKKTEFMSNKEKIQASLEIKSSAETALRLNPKSDYAHHMLGRWHQEMATIGDTSRAIAKAIYGEIPTGSLPDALNHFDKARKLQSKRLIHQVEYGRTLAMLGRKEEAKTEINKGLKMPSRDPDDNDAKYRGQQTLKDI